jgi:hypothetical protein
VIDHGDADVIGRNDVSHATTVSMTRPRSSREDGTVDVRKRAGLELASQTRCHRVERHGELAEFVIGRDSHLRRKVLVPRAPRAFDQFLERPERAANLRDGEQCRDQQSQPCHWNEYRLERSNGCENVGLELGGNDGPATNAEVRAKE